MSASAAPLAESPPLSEPARIVNTFIAPTKTFADLRRNSSWWAPWVLISVFALLFMYSIQAKVGFEQVSRNEIAKNARLEAQIERMPPPQRAQVFQTATSRMKFFMYGVPITGILSFLIMAAILMASFNFGAGASIPFKTSLAVVTYGNLPTVVYSLLGIVSLLAGVNPEGFNVKNAVATNPAYFMDANSNPFLYGMASALDVFVLWTIVLMAVGYSSVSKLKRSTTLGVIIGWYLVFKLAASGLAALVS